jgi:hypothetical protein
MIDWSRVPPALRWAIRVAYFILVFVVVDAALPWHPRGPLEAARSGAIMGALYATWLIRQDLRERRPDRGG